MFQPPKEPDLLRIEHVMGFSPFRVAVRCSLLDSLVKTPAGAKINPISRGYRRSGRTRGVPN
jgi:hypothetical protein